MIGRSWESQPVLLCMFWVTEEITRTAFVQRMKRVLPRYRIPGRIRLSHPWMIPSRLSDVTSGALAFSGYVLASEIY